MSGHHPPPSRRRFLGAVVASGSLAGLVAACRGSGGPAQPSATHADATRADGNGSDLDVTRFGATGDGRTDDSDAIDRALAALQPGGSLTFPARKVFRHSRVIVIRTPDTSILGPGRLLASAEQTSALQVEADGVTVRGLSLGITTTTQRWSAPEQHKLYLGARKNIVVRDVRIDGSAAAGLFCHGASQLEIRDVQVANTRADGIHLTNGCHDVTIESPVTSATGDDGVAVVSYRTDDSICRDITVRDARVTSTAGGRGMSVVGGSNIAYRDVSIADTSAAGLYIACEDGDFVTSPVDGVTVVGGTVRGANTDAAIDHGAVLVYSARADGGGVRDVTVSDLVVTNTRASASRQVGVVVDGASTVSGVTFARITLDATPTPYEGNAPVDDVTLRSVRAGAVVVVATVTP